MSGDSTFLGDWLRWRAGRQGTGYEKMLLLANPYLLPFDCYLLRYRPGTGVPEHTDPVNGKRHYRMNIVLWHAGRGGDFVCTSPIYDGSRVKLFRPDVSIHSVTAVESGTRYVVSVGWVLDGSRKE